MRVERLSIDQLILQAIQEWVLRCVCRRLTRRSAKPESDQSACFRPDRAQIGPMAMARQMAHISIPTAAIIIQMVIKLCLKLVWLLSS